MGKLFTSFFKIVLSLLFVFFVVSCQKSLGKEKSVYQKKVTDRNRVAGKNARSGGRQEPKSSSEKVFRGVTLSGKILDKNIRVGEQFSYYVVLTDERKSVKKGNQVSLDIVKVSFPRLKLLGKKKYRKKDKKGRKIVYRYTFMPRKKGKHTITPMAIVVKKGRRSKEVDLKGISFVVRPAKKSWFGKMGQHHWWQSIKKKPQSWFKSLRKSKFFLFLKKKLSWRPLDNVFADIFALLVFGGVSYFVYKWLKQPMSRLVAFVKNKFR